jgi:FkbM family methyltransferase
VALVEPQPDRQPALRALAATTPGSFVVWSALGRTAGDVAFRLDETNSAVVADGSEQASIMVPCTTLDAVLDAQPAFVPNMLKLDLQGGEMEAIAGAERHLPRFDVVVLEVSLLQIGDGPIFADVERTMETRGYRLYDVIPQYYRPLDGALWQMDAFYVRRDSALVASRSWA